MKHGKTFQTAMTAGPRYLFNRKEGGEKIFFTNREAISAAFVQVSLKELKRGPMTMSVPASVARSLMKRLAENGALAEAGFSRDEIDAARVRGVVPAGYGVEQIVPAGCGAGATPNNVCLMETGLSEYLMRHLWRFLHRDLVAEKEACEKKGRPYELIRVGLSGFRSVMRAADWEKVLDKPLLRRARLVEERLRVRRIKAMPLTILATAEGVLLAHPAFTEIADVGLLKNQTGMVPAVVNVRLASAEERQEIKAEYGQVRRHIIRSFAAQGKLPEIRAEKQKVIAETGWLPDRYPYTCHHIVPRALGGSNQMTNICWLPAAEHVDLHVIVNRYMHELKNHYAELATQGLAYLVLPIPVSFCGEQLRVISPVDQRLVSMTKLASDMFAEQYQRRKAGLKKKKKLSLSDGIQRRLLVARYRSKMSQKEIDVSHVRV